MTIGNSLRRILLSSLEGSAVTQIKIHGAQHEFTTLPGVVEDMTDVVLNVKSLVVKNYTDQTKVLRIEKNTEGVVTGADVQTDETVEMINKDHILATLTDDVPFVLEMVVENGRGYVPASEHSPNVQEIGIIPVDAVYSPVIRVRYEIEETRVGQKTNYDKLTIEIWTNGSIHPEMALVEVGQSAPQALEPVRAIYASWARALAAAGRSTSLGSLDTAVEQKLSMTLAELKLSVRASNCLESENIQTCARSGAANGRSIARSAQFRRNDAARSQRKTGRDWACVWECECRLKLMITFHACIQIAMRIRRYLTDMRHRRRSRVLGRSPSHRKALLRNLASALFLTERRQGRISGREASAEGEGPDRYHDAKGQGSAAAGRTLHYDRSARLSRRCEEAEKSAPTAERNSDAWRKWRKSKQWSQVGRSHGAGR